MEICFTVVRVHSSYKLTVKYMPPDMVIGIHLALIFLATPVLRNAK